jgi:hypothetical protein
VAGENKMDTTTTLTEAIDVAIVCIFPSYFFREYEVIAIKSRDVDEALAVLPEGADVFYFCNLIKGKPDMTNSSPYYYPGARVMTVKALTKKKGEKWRNLIDRARVLGAEKIVCSRAGHYYPFNEGDCVI